MNPKLGAAAKTVDKGVNKLGNVRSLPPDSMPSAGQPCQVPYPRFEEYATTDGKKVLD